MDRWMHSSWNFSADGSTPMFPTNLKNSEENLPKIRANKITVREARAKGNFAFSFYRTQTRQNVGKQSSPIVAHVPTCHCQLCETEIFFDSPEFRNFVSEITATKLGDVQDFFASWYRPGDFLTEHSDNGVQRSVALIFGFTKNWITDFGGNLNFVNRYEKIFTPAFNSLLIFNVKDDASHFVSEVVTHVTQKRFMVVGWYT